MGFLNYTVTCFLNLHSTVETGIFQRTFSLRWLWTFHFCCLQQSSCVAACWRLPPEVSNDGTHSLYNKLSALIKNVGITDLSEPFVAHGYFLPQSELARCTGKSDFALPAECLILSDFSLLPSGLQKLSVEPCVLTPNDRRLFFDWQVYKDKTYFEQINWFKPCSPQQAVENVCDRLH